MQIIVGLLGSDDGTIWHAGRLGYCPQQPMLWDKLTVDEHFELLARAYKLDDARRVLGPADDELGRRGCVLHAQPSRGQPPDRGRRRSRLTGWRLARGRRCHTRRARRRAGGILVDREIQVVAMSARAHTATAMAFRDQRRRPLVLILLVIFPAYVITKSIAETRPTPREIALPGGVEVTTTMKLVHGPEMAKISVAFAAALVGVFVMQSALQGDRRLVAAGLRAREVITARLTVIAAATALVVAVAVAVTAVSFTPAHWPPMIAALILIGLIYAGTGALAGALLDKLPATYLILFLVMTDLGVVQTPMFHAAPPRLAFLLPGYAPTRMMLDAAFARSFYATDDLLIALGWLIAAGLVAYLVLKRAIGVAADGGRIQRGSPGRGGIDA
jgi:hypothetical protein